MQNLVRTPKNLGHAIRQARREKNWTQAELATRSGVWQETISKAEAGKGGTKLDTIFALLAALDVEMSDVSAYGSKYGYLLRECLLLIVATEEWTMRKTTNSPGEKIVKDIKRATRKHYSSEEKIRIVLDGLRGEDSIAELCRREGISQGIYYKWSKDFMEAGKKRLAGDTARAANTDEVKELRREAKDLKEVVAEQTLELRLLKKSMIGDGGDHE